MGMIGTFMQSMQAGLQAGYSAARRVYEEPAQSHRKQTWLNVSSAYALLWAYYNTSLFDRSIMTYERGASAWNIWSAYKQHYTLYRDIRLIYNPVRRLVNFYAGQVYPGVLSIDGKKLPDGVPLAIPFSEDTPDTLKAAIAQFWQWSNWQSRKTVMIRYGAALGSALVELVDDLERGVVSSEIIWPGFISHMDLDPAGNIKEYHLQYLSQDEESGRTYTYRKEVTKETFRYFKDDEPFSYNGQGSTIPNPYGFVPAVWVKHEDVGGIQGSPAIAGSLGKVDELNNLVSHAHDQVHKVIGAPMVLWTSTNVRNMFSAQKRGVSEDEPVPTSDQENMMILKGSSDGHVDSLAGNLPLGEVILYVDRLLGEIEQDHPELVFYKELRAMSQVTGPAASRLVGDVANRVSEAAANYDQASQRLFQMAVAIGGMRASSGAWGQLNRQQQKFLSFNLDSYERGDLDFEIMPRQVLTPTRQEIGAENESMWRGVYFGHQAGVPAEFVLRQAGWTDDKIAMLTQAQQQMVVAQASAARAQDVTALSGQGPQLPPGIGQGQGR
jgi:hypothetical protein